ncbi:MAG: FtsX-like permease family protein, partial [Candidatus Neomarinimicrobiota bacterium]
GGSVRLYLQPLQDIYLRSDFEMDFGDSGDITYVYLFSAIAILILLIACFNFINLATARSARRAREVGLRKTMGAQRSRIVLQFIGESVLLSLLAVAVTGILLELSLPVFNSLTGYNFDINYFSDWRTLPFLLVFGLVTGVLAGVYPAFFLSSYQPVKVLKGSVAAGLSTRFRSILVVIQFVISVVLIIGTLTINGQLKYVKNKKLGFTSEQVLVIPNIPNNGGRDFRTLQDELSRVPGVVAIGASSRTPGRGIRKSVVFPEGFAVDEPQTVDVLIIDPGFIPTLEIELAQGRNFSADLASDTVESVIINELAATKFGWRDPIGKRFLSPQLPGTENSDPELVVVGVVKDFHIASLRMQIDPLVIFYDASELADLSIKIRTADISKTVAAIEAKWQSFHPDRPFNYFFLDDTFNNLYLGEERLGKLVLDFSLLAIFVGCLGLFGLASFSAEQRTKEIGIRKTLGASVADIVRLLSKDFVVLVIISNLIAWPVAWYALNDWLENFAYRTTLGPVTFLTAALIALVIAMLTVSYQAIKAAIANPVDSLKYE